MSIKFRDGPTLTVESVAEAMECGATHFCEEYHSWLKVDGDNIKFYYIGGSEWRTMKSPEVLEQVIDGTVIDLKEWK